MIYIILAAIYLLVGISAVYALAKAVGKPKKRPVLVMAYSVLAWPVLLFFLVISAMILFSGWVQECDDHDGECCCGEEDDG